MTPSTATPCLFSAVPGEFVAISVPLCAALHDLLEDQRQMAGERTGTWLAENAADEATA